MAEKKVEAQKEQEAQDEQNKDVIVDNDTGKAINATDAAHAEETEVVQEEARELGVQEEQAETPAPKVEGEAPKPVTPDEFYNAGYDSIALHAGGIAYVSPWGLEMLRAISAEEAGLSGGSENKERSVDVKDIKPATKLKADADQAAVVKAYNDLADKFNSLLGKL